MGRFVYSDFQNFLHNVVDYKDTEDYLTAHDEVIPVGNITDQPYSTNLIGCNRPTSSWKFNHQSEIDHGKFVQGSFNKNCQARCADLYTNSISQYIEYK